MGLHELDTDLLTAEQTLNHWYANFPQIIRNEANAKVIYETAWADPIQKITANVPEGAKQPTIAVMESEATQMCAKEIKDKRLAEAEAEIAKKLIGIAETTLSSIQSRAGLYRIEAGLSGMK